MRRLGLIAVASLLFIASGRTTVQGQSSGLVRVTPLGSHTGELCRNDRAMLFEDPGGVRILYDPGRTVDESDPRLGDVHVILLSHAHNDHIGDARPNRSAPGTCAAPAVGPANADSNFVSIAATKGAAALAPGELSTFLGRKIQVLRGTATPACPELGLENEIDVPLGGPCAASLRPGGSRTVVRVGSPGLVRIAVVPAVHSNGINAAFIEAPGVAAGLSGYGGGEGGFVITFTNGLVAYLTGDTGMFGDMSTIIGRYYRPTLMVMNMSDTVTLGPLEAAFTIRELIRPVTVMPTHVNEAATNGGAPVSGTRVSRFMSVVGSSVEIVLPVSDVTRAFDGSGRCIGCTR